MRGMNGKLLSLALVSATLLLCGCINAPSAVTDAAIQFASDGDVGGEYLTYVQRDPALDLQQKQQRIDRVNSHRSMLQAARGN